MELKLKNVGYEYKCKDIINNFTYTFEDKYIYGILGKNKTLLLEIIEGNKNINGNLTANRISYKNKDNYLKQVSLIEQRPKFHKKTVALEFKYYIRKTKYEHKNINLKIINSLKLVGLNVTILEKTIDQLSESEKILVNIAIKLLVNPKIILFDDIFNSLDATNKKIVFNLINKLKNNLHKIIIIASNNTNLLYEKTDMILYIENNIVREDLVDKFFKDIDFLKFNQIEIPYLIDFTYKVKSRNIKLSYHKDILDLIKDIYKHV